jgi:hypothetical protein
MVNIRSQNKRPHCYEPVELITLITAGRSVPVELINPQHWLIFHFGTVHKL